MLSAILLAAASSVPATALDAFESVCIEPSSRAEVLGVLEAGGWSTHSPNAESPLGKLLAKSESLPGLEQVTLRFAIFEKQLEERPVQVVVNLTQAVGPGGSLIIDCNLYDFEATGPADSAQLERLAGAEPDQANEVAGAVVMFWSEPFGPSTMMRTVFFPNEPTIIEATGFSGLVFTSFRFEG